MISFALKRTRVCRDFFSASNSVHTQRKLYIICLVRSQLTHCSQLWYTVLITLNIKKLKSISIGPLNSSQEHHLIWTTEIALLIYIFYL